MIIDGRFRIVRSATPWFAHPFGGREFVRLVWGGSSEPLGEQPRVLAEAPYTKPLTDGEFRFACQFLIAGLAEELQRLIPGSESESKCEEKR